MDTFAGWNEIYPMGSWTLGDELFQGGNGHEWPFVFLDYNNWRKLSQENAMFSPPKKDVSPIKFT